MDPVERTDFPTSRRGYDPGAVADHLRALAERIERLEAQARRPAGDSMAATASQRVEGIIAAAEASADELRDEARHEARGHVEAVAAAAAGLGARIAALQAELDAVIDDTRGLRSAAGEPELAIAPPASAAAPEPAIAPPTSAPEPAIAPTSSAPPAAAADPSPPDPATAALDPSPPDPAPAASDPSLPDPAPAAPDEDGARLAALDLALQGSSREDAAAYLSEHFGLERPEPLLDEVFAKAGR